MVKRDRIIKVFHKLPEMCGTRLAMLPKGLHVNSGMDDAQSGQRIVFYDGWKRESVRLVRKSTVSVASSVFGLLARHLYGQSIAGLMEYWSQLYLLEGLKIDDTECWLIEIADGTE